MKKYLVIILLSFIALWPFFRKGFYTSHDGQWMVIRFSAFHQALVSGQFPVRYVERLNNNYGYPVLNFLYPLPFYLAEIPKVFGFGFVDSIKVVFIASTVASTVAMFWALSQIASANAAIAGAIIYLFIPYRFVDLYVRGSLGENLAFATVPLVAGCIFKLAKNQHLYAPVLSLAVGLLILSHNVMAMLFLPFFLILASFAAKISRLILSAFILGILISTFFWLPALHDLGFVKLSQIKVSEIANHLVDPEKLIIPSWGYGPNPNSTGGLSVQIGIVAISIVAAAVILILKSQKKDNLIVFLTAVFLLIILANTKLAAIFWQNIPAVDVIQFPWRLHSLVITISAFLTVYVIDSAKDKKTLLSSFVAIAAVISTILYTKPAAFVDYGDDYYSTNEDTTNVRDEYLPIWAKNKPTGRASEKLELLGEGQITTQSTGHLKYQAHIESQDKTILQVNTIYFPTFVAKVNGQKVPISYDNDLGLVRLELPEGIHEVIISYTGSPVARASEAISLLALFGTGAYFFILWRKSKITADF